VGIEEKRINAEVNALMEMCREKQQSKSRGKDWTVKVKVGVHTQVLCSAHFCLQLSWTLWLTII